MVKWSSPIFATYSLKLIGVGGWDSKRLDLEPILCSLPFLGYCTMHNITGRGPGHTVIHTKQVINGLNLPAEPGQGVEMGKRVRKTHSKVKKWGLVSFDTSSPDKVQTWRARFPHKCNARLVYNVYSDQNVRPAADVRQDVQYLVQAHSPSTSPIFPLLESKRCLLSPEGEPWVGGRRGPCGPRGCWPPKGASPIPTGLSKWYKFTLLYPHHNYLHQTMQCFSIQTLLKDLRGKGGPPAEAKTLSPKELKIQFEV